MGEGMSSADPNLHCAKEFLRDDAHGAGAFRARKGVDGKHLSEQVCTPPARRARGHRRMRLLAVGLVPMGEASPEGCWSGSAGLPPAVTPSGSSAAPAGRLRRSAAGRLTPPTPAATIGG